MANSTDIKRKSKKHFWSLVGLSLVGVVALKLSFAFFFIGMLPAIVAYMVDHDKHKYIFWTVTAFNFAGVFPYQMDIMIQGNSLAAVKAELGNVIVLFVMYSAAACGWIVVWVSPVLATTVLHGIYQGKIIHLENIQKKIEEEWGDEVKRKEIR